MSELLRLDDVTMRFGGLAALSGVSMSVRRGEIFGLMGANGAGKTTLFALVGGQLRPTAGRILFKGEPIHGRRPDQICRLGISRTFQIVRPFPGVSTLDNVIVSALYGAASRSRAQAREAGLAALEAVGLAALANIPAGALTLSAQKRLEIARALATGAELLLLDEVLAGLTPAEVEPMLETLAYVKKDRDLTIVVIEHVVGALMRLSDRILALDHGEVIAMGEPAEVARDARVLEAYFGGA
jgi:branched-chain amino acid transport system ATP-binding protein